MITALEGACLFMHRYGAPARKIAREAVEQERDELLTIAEICKNLARRPPETFHEAVQSVWFLFVIGYSATIPQSLRIALWRVYARYTTIYV